MVSKLMLTVYGSEIAGGLPHCVLQFLARIIAGLIKMLLSIGFLQLRLRCVYGLAGLLKIGLCQLQLLPQYLDLTDPFRKTICDRLRRQPLFVFQLDQQLFPSQLVC